MIALLLDIPPPRRGSELLVIIAVVVIVIAVVVVRGGDWKHEHRRVASHFTFLPVLQTFRLVLIESERCILIDLPGQTDVIKSSFR